MEASQNDYANIPTKQIVYKGKTKEIPAYNSDAKLCENYIIAKHRYCKFEKHLNSQFCIYHMPKENEEKVEFIVCPIDPSHRVLAEKFHRHIKVCNKLGEKKRLINNVWYSEKINKVNNNESIIKNLHKLQELKFEPSTQNLSSLYTLRWEDLSEDEISLTIDKILKCYEILKEDYKKYVEKEDLEKILNEKMKNNSCIVTKEDPDSDFKIILSAMQINPEKDFDFTTDLPKSEKNGRQNKSITNVMKNFDLLDNKNIFIEFGAGKGGLSYYINTLNNDNSIHILLERDGVRYKKDKYCEGLIRFRTDILDFNLNYIDTHFSENKDKIKIKTEEGSCISVVDVNYKLLGVAKHICGCALDLSLSCLINYNDQSKVKGVCMATCCHHLSQVEYLNNLNLYTEYLNMNLREIILLFKATSWIFGPIEIKEDVTNLKSHKIFKQKGFNKNFIGLVSKYIVDLARVFYLISKNYKVFYIKYCKNEITTENNLILAINENLE